jgi:integrase
LRAALSAIDKGEHVDPYKTTVGAFVRGRIDLWEAATTITARTAQNYRQAMSQHIQPFLGDKPLQGLSTIAVEAWHAHLRAGGLHPKTIINAHSVLSKALREAVRHHLVARNVAALQPPPAAPQTEMQIVPADRLDEFVAALQGHDLRAPAIVALFTGLRLGEVLALAWEDVDLDARSLTVRATVEETKAHGRRIKPPKTKAGRRTVSMPQIVVDTVRRHRVEQLELCLQLGLGMPHKTRFVFGQLDGQLRSVRVVSMAWGRLARRIGWPQITFHALRHCHASMLIAAGVDLATIAKRLGHASPKITLQTYAHMMTADDSRAADAIDIAFGGGIR